MRKFFIVVSMFFMSLLIKAEERIFSVRGTHYHPVPSQGYGSGRVTADGSRISLEKLKSGALRWIALSRDLLQKIPLGSKVKIESEEHPEVNGVWEVRDKMGKRHTQSVDFLGYPGQFKFGNIRCTMEPV